MQEWFEKEEEEEMQIQWVSPRHPLFTARDCSGRWGDVPNVNLTCKAWKSNFQLDCNSVCMWQNTEWHSVSATQPCQTPMFQLIFQGMKMVVRGRKSVSWGRRFIQLWRRQHELLKINKQKVNNFFSDFFFYECTSNFPMIISLYLSTYTYLITDLKVRLSNT